MKQKRLKQDFHSIEKLSSKNLNKFTRAFYCQKEDLFHKELGVLFGIIQITDYSKNSEYIPNLLISVIKKSFYSKQHNDPEDNLRLAMKKANLALADLAEHDITEWTNNIHAVIGVFHKSKLLFTQVGQGIILIGRKKSLMPLYIDEQKKPVHPVKTFQDIFIGEIKKNDKFIFSTPEILNLFSLSDFKRLFDTFSNKEFDNIIYKTIEKEGVNISTQIVNIFQESQNVTVTEKSVGGASNTSIDKLIGNKNFLGASTEKNIKKQEAKKKTEKKEELKSNKSSKKDKKKIKTQKRQDSVQNNNKNINHSNEKSVPKKKMGIQSSPKIDLTKDKKEKGVKGIKKKLVQDLQKPKPKKKKEYEKSPFEETPEIYIKDEDEGLFAKAKKPSKQKLKKFFTSKNYKKKGAYNNKTVEHKKISIIESKIFNQPRKIITKFIVSARNIFSDLLSKIKKEETKKIKKADKKKGEVNINPQKKLLILLLLIFIPILIKIIFFTKPKEKLPPMKSLPAPTELQKPGDTDQTSLQNIANLPAKITALSNNKNALLILTKNNNLYVLDKKTKQLKQVDFKDASISQNIKSIEYLPVLNLFFLIADSQILSYSPVTKKISSNKIIFPPGFTLLGQGTFLDYIYLLNKKDGQIYRYPRANGGFGSSKKWLRTPLSNTNIVTSMAVDEVIRIGYSNGLVEKYEKGVLKNKKNFNNKHVDKIVTNNILKNYYILDNKNKQLLQVSKTTDKIISVYQNHALTNSDTFTVDEKNNFIYLNVDNTLKGIKLKVTK